MAESVKNEKIKNENQLVEKAKDDEASFEILYEHYFPKIYGFIFKRTGNKEATEDLVSSTFMKVFCNLSGFSPKKGSFSSWIYTIANNNLIDYYRKQGRKKESGMEGLENKPIESDSPEDEMQASYEATIVQKALGDLKEKYQRILHLKFYAELSNQEIAEVMGMSVNNSRVTIHRALKKFALIHKKYEK
ncbi:MAG: sigma-70 family RNA polymerase sigma factor [Candidatus Magasanikbacteria bacterium]|nr:sigma-70 family RNA polymerase sigma factor [Candidatus Magasanikbacteria bacterium]